MSNYDLLIVEDNPDVQHALPALFSIYNVTTKIVRTVKEAKEALEENPRYILLDLLLPDGNGRDIIKFIEKNNLKVKIAITTGLPIDDDDEITKYKILTKPMDFDEVLEFLQSP